MSDSGQFGRLSTRRRWSDRITKQVIDLGGDVVIAAITLIFGYLLWVVSPLLLPGSIEAPTGFNVVEREPVLVDVSENGEVFLRISLCLRPYRRGQYFQLPGQRSRTDANVIW